MSDQNKIEETENPVDDEEIERILAACYRIARERARIVRQQAAEKASADKDTTTFPDSNEAPSPPDL